MKKIDMTGWIMSEHGVPDSRLTVIEEAEPHITKSGVKKVRWKCKCSCGKEVIVKGASLRDGNTKSCGCLATELIIQRNIESGEPIKIGDKFGHLTVIADLGMRKQKTRDKNWRWSLCQCDCGSNPVEVPNNMLKNGSKKSCGCIKSLGEDIIKTILEKNNINYIREYHFDDFKNKNTNIPYRFDFAIFQNKQLSFLIEFDGRQHYTGPESGWSKSISLEEIQKRDALKNEYCKSHNIILKRIPYFEINQINLENIFSDKFNIE